MMGYISKKWLRWVIENKDHEIVYMIDETAQSPKPLKNRSRRYWNFTFNGKTVVVPKFYQVAIPFLKFNNSYYCLKDLGYMGFKRTHKKYFNQLNYPDQLSFVKALRLIIGDRVRIIADKRPISRILSEKTKLIEIRSKATTQRVDAVFGFKTSIYNMIRNKTITNYSEFNLEYEKSWKKINVKEI